jgi:hypothetical protein
MCTSQRATSCCLYKHWSWSIDVPNNRSNTIYFYLSFYPGFLLFSSFHRLDQVSAVSTPWVAVILAYLLSRHRMDRGEAPSSSTGGTPDYHQN